MNHHYHWLKNDMPSMIGAEQRLKMNQGVVKGVITVTYTDYKINKDLPDYIF